MFKTGSTTRQPLLTNPTEQSPCLIAICIIRNASWRASQAYHASLMSAIAKLFQLHSRPWFDQLLANSQMTHWNRKGLCSNTRGGPRVKSTMQHI